MSEETKLTSVSPGIINIPTPTDNVLPADRQAELDQLLARYKPSDWIKPEQFLALFQS